MKLVNDITAERVKEVFSYDPLTGIFTWRVPRPGRKAGEVAGFSRANGYLKLQVDRRAYLAHRIAFLYMHGRWPVGQVDHIDGNRANNRIENLREVDQVANMQNRHRAQKNSSTGFLGVRKDPRRFANPFMAQIMIDGKQKHLGNFPTAEKEHEAYLAAKAQLHAGYVQRERQQGAGK